ncbi:hypothetical protein KSP40_PGU007499 [Platanthera guangdongensis]|uniref:Uncharacterized protein n=1 Tax=Platanthera guangdongensis TaxID=2320717 RepID=A0ABR2N4C4_9ASPA
MGFITSKRSSELTNALPKIKSTSGKSYSSHQLNDASRSQCKNKDLRPRKKSHAVFNESEIEDIDLEKQLKVAQEMSSESDCLWLSSDCNSLYSLVSDQSGEIWELSGSNISPKGDFFMGEPSVKDLSVYGSTCSSLSTLDDTTCSICESDRTSIWISSLDVTPEGTQFVQQKNEVDFSYSDFSSPSNNSKRNSQLKISYSSSNSTNFSHLRKPSRSSSREFSEPDKSCLPISPRKNGRLARTKEINVLKSVDSKLRKTNSIPTSRNIMQRPESSQTPKKSTKTSVFSGKNTQKSTPATLHLSRSSPQHSSRLVLCKSSTKECNSNTKKENHQLKFQKQTHKQEELPMKHLLEFEDSHFQESLIEGVSIEKLIGLDEFDGYEGLDANFREEFHFQL